MKILFVVGARDLSNPDWSLDYQCDTLFHGLVSLGHDVTDSNYIRYLHQPLTDDMRPNVYGLGFTIGGKLPDRSGIDRSDEVIRNRIKDHYYDIVIYGSIHRCSDYLADVCEHYSHDEIAIVDGEDHDGIHAQGMQAGIYFKRQQSSGCNALPISFAIPEEMFSDAFVVNKEYDFAPMIPYEPSTYVYTNERAYYDMYAKARFAYTMMKASWDSLRHYEIVAAHCVPVFTDFRHCPNNVLTTWPRYLQAQANGLAYRWSTGNKDEEEYNRILHDFYEYGKSNLTTKILAEYVLSKIRTIGESTHVLTITEDMIPQDTRDCVKNLPEQVGGTDIEAVVVNSYGSSIPKILLATGKVSKVYCVEDYSNGNKVYSDVHTDTFKNELTAQHDRRIIPVFSSICDAVASGKIPDATDVMFLVGCSRNDKLIHTLRNVCNSCVELSGDGYANDTVRSVIDGVYGIGACGLSCGNGWFVRDPRRKLCVVTPVYRALNNSEVQSVERFIAVTQGRYDMCIVCPESFNTDLLPQCMKDAYSQVIRFASKYFKGVDTYSKLMTLRAFYDKFSQYTHILIYQTDGFIYRDDLFERWLKYDYVGAPWCWGCKVCTRDKHERDKIGNGGVSVRRVTAMQHIISGCGDRTHPEDMRLVLSYVNNRAHGLYMPPCEEALNFSVEHIIPPGMRPEDLNTPSFTHKTTKEISEELMRRLKNGEID